MLHVSQYEALTNQVISLPGSLRCKKWTLAPQAWERHCFRDNAMCPFSTKQNSLSTIVFAGSNPLLSLFCVSSLFLRTL